MNKTENLSEGKATWQTGEPPKDRPIVAIGKVMVSDEFSTTAIPFCYAIEWRELSGHQDWYLYFHDGFPMAVRRALDEKIIIHNWIEFPPRAASYPPHKPDNMELHS